MKKKILLLSLIVCLVNSVFAGGWTKGKGKGYFKLNQSIIRGDQFYAGDGSLQDIITSGVHITSLYGEYGVSDRVDVIGFVPFFTRLTINSVRFSDGAFQEGDSFNGFGDVDLGVKYGLRQGSPFVISTSLLLGVPFGVTDGGNSQLLQTGDGEFNQFVRFDFGYSFPKAFYTNASVGFNNRTEGFSEEFRYEFELGYKYQKNSVLGFKMQGIESFNNGDPRGSGGNGIFSNNLEFMSLGLELSHSLSESFGFSGAYRVITSGQFVLAAPSIEFGLFLDIK